MVPDEPPGGSRIVRALQALTDEGEQNETGRNISLCFLLNTGAIKCRKIWCFYCWATNFLRLILDHLLKGIDRILFLQMGSKASEDEKVVIKGIRSFYPELTYHFWSVNVTQWLTQDGSQKITFFHGIHLCESLIKKIRYTNLRLAQKLWSKSRNGPQEIGGKKSFSNKSSTSM